MIDDMVALLGYETVNLRRPVGERKSVNVRLLPVRLLPQYAAVFSVETEIVLLCTDLSADEADKLLPEDSGKIFNTAHDINFAPFSEWLGRKEKALKMQALAYNVNLPTQTSKPAGQDSAS